jgi:outer membrane lipoprotein-sorting protein
MFRVLIVFFILNFYNPVFSSIKEKIISQMQFTNNLSFDFIQTINNKNENGRCIIKYPGKIWCEYDNSNKKIIVSNGKSLVIKNRNSGSYYIYPLKKTPLVFLLDKKNLSLVGWQTKDIYQNLTITFLSSIKINQEINNKIFILPANN